MSCGQIQTNVAHPYDKTTQPDGKQCSKCDGMKRYGLDAWPINVSEVHMDMQTAVV